MKFNQLKAFEEYVATHTSPLYLILSEDDGFRQWGEGVIQKSLKGVSVQRWERFTKERVLSSYLLPSLFGEKELFIASLEEGESFLTASLLSPPPGRHLLLTGKRLLSNTKLFKLIDEHGLIFQLPQMKPYEKERILIDWLNETARQERKILPADVAKRFVEMQEGNFATLQREWEKLLIYTLNRSSITHDDLQKIAIRTPKEEVFSFVDALLRKDGAFAYKRLDDLLKLESSPIALLKLVRNGFQNLLQLHTLLALGAPPEAIQKDLPFLQGRLLEQLVLSARKTTLKGVQKTLCVIDQLESEYKGSVRGDVLFLDYFISKVI